jgi:uncharacterized protein (DUF4415 family)
MKKPDPCMTDDENPEWTDEDFKRAVPARLSHPDLVEAWEREKGLPRPVQQVISIRIDQDVLATFKATGKGWQKRMNAALRMGAEKLGPYIGESEKKRPVRKKQSVLVK